MKKNKKWILKATILKFGLNKPSSNQNKLKLVKKIIQYILIQILKMILVGRIPPFVHLHNL